MRKLLAIIILGLILSYCQLPEQNYEETRFDQMEKPLVVIAKNPSETWVTGSIVVKDKYNRTYTFTTSKAFGAALVNTYDVGDTIK